MKFVILEGSNGGESGITGANSNTAQNDLDPNVVTKTILGAKRSELLESDRRMLRCLLDSEGLISTHELSEQLGLSLSSTKRKRNRLEETYLIRTYSLDPMKFGYRKIDLLIYTEGGGTMDIGKELLKREEVTYAARTIGEHTIDLRVEVFVKDNGILLNLLEDVKAMKGVRDVIWTEVVETIGRKSPPNHIIF